MVKVNIANRVNKIRLRKAKQQQVFRKKIAMGQTKKYITFLNIKKI